MDIPNLLVVGILVGLGIFMSTPEGHSADRDLLSGEAMFKDVIFYSGLGHHRTATAVDKATSQWLEDRLKKAGYAIRTQEWKTKQFFPQETYIEIDLGKRLDAFPVWWPKPTDHNGIMARLSTDGNGLKGRIFLMKNLTGPGFSIDENLIRQITASADKGALAIIMASYYNGRDTVASDEFIGLNAMQSRQEQWPIPVVMVRAKDFSRLEAAADKTKEVRLVSTGLYDQAAVGLNVIGSLERSPDFKTILVSTPSSGWFTCAGERGSGIGIWLALAEWAAKEPSKINWIFAATSGHELRGLGTEYYLKSPLVPPPEKVYLWTHIGAWQAMYRYLLKEGKLAGTHEMDHKIFQFRGDSIAVPVNTGFGDPGLKVRIIPRIQFGDLIQVVEYGYKNIGGISFGHPYHHSTQDLPEVTGPELLESIAKGYQKFFKAVIAGF